LEEKFCIMIIDPKVIEDYNKLQEKIAKLFEDAKIEKKQFFEAINMSRPTFARKLKEKTFSPDELLALVNEINKTLNLK